jgi:GTP cyclohydrolase I
MKDIQSTKDKRGISINKVGISDVRHPIQVMCRNGQSQHTVATFSVCVNLPHDVKGTHMSRLVNAINSNQVSIGSDSMRQMISQIRRELDAEEACMTAEFPYFMAKSAPVTSMQGQMDYDCKLTGSINSRGFDLTTEVTVPVTSLCPCSKEISDRGAHNQRSRVSIAVKTHNEPVWVDDLIAIAEESASAPLYSLLKRPDEKFVTEQAYDNPVFVEDLVRGVASCLKEDDNISWFRVRSVNEESIHNHNAFAEIIS